MVRNAMFLAIAMLSLLLQPSAGPIALTGWQWIPMFAKEAFIGGAIGLLFAGVMWAFEAAGQLIDTKVGTTQAQVNDPLSGHQTTLNGALFSRLASFVFMSGGGFMVLIGTLLESYAMWPVHSPLPTLAEGGMRLFEGEFGRIMAADAAGRRTGAGAAVRGRGRAGADQPLRAATQRVLAVAVAEGGGGDLDHLDPARQPGAAAAGRPAHARRHRAAHLRVLFGG